MKSITTVVVIAVVSAMIGVGAFALFGGGSAADERDLRTDLEAGLTDAQGRILELEEELVALRGNMSADESRTAPLPAMPRSDDAEFRQLRAELEALREEVRRLSGSPLLSPDVAAEDVTEFIDDRITAADTKRKEAERERKQREGRAWARGAAQKQANALAKKLSLDASQTERLRESLATNMEAVMPLFGTLKDGDASREDRLDAVARIRASGQSLRDEARGYLDTDQHRRFVEESQADSKGVETWLDSIVNDLSGDADDRR